MSVLPDVVDIVASLGLGSDPARTRVAVAMSGGVDSSVAAALLRYAGYDVVGVTLQLYPDTEPSSGGKSCCAGRDIGDARRVCEKIGIPHYVLDYEDRFRTSVIDAFVEGYAKGETPVPCIDCNRTVKFRDLVQVARDIGSAALVTGHYVTSRRGPVGMEMYRPVDSERDQSYFLFATTPEQLGFVRFPIGEYPKSQVREFAEALELSVSEKRDSQDICFVASGGYSSLIEKLRPDTLVPGDIVHVDGRTLGRHSGIVGFTVGQRRGIKLSSDEPLYVVGLDAVRHRVIVGPRCALGVHRLYLRDVNWLGDRHFDEEIGTEGRFLYVRLRSTGDFVGATLRREGDVSGSVCVDLHCEYESVSCGQACVFYGTHGVGARVLGGGIVDRTWNSYIGNRADEIGNLSACSSRDSGW